MGGVQRDPGLQTLVDAVHGRGDLPAVALAVLDGGAETVRWAGAGAATDPGQRLRIASVTKTVLALAAHGLGLVDAAVPGGRVTVADLLSHTAGQPLELPGVDWLNAPPADPAALSAAVTAGAPAPVRAPFRYSNVGYWRLGGLLADAAGAPVERVVGDVLAAIPGAQAIDFGDADLPGHLLTTRGRLVRHVGRFPPARRASGGLAADLPAITFLGRALLAGIARHPTLAGERAALAGGWGWTAGLERWTTAGRVLFGHHGSWGGTRTLLVVDPADGRTAAAVVTSEAGNPALRALLTAIGLPPAAPSVAVPGDAYPLPLGGFADGVATARLTAGDTTDTLLLHTPADADPVAARVLAPGLAQLLGGHHAGEPLTTPDGGVLRIGVRSLDPR